MDVDALVDMLRLMELMNGKDTFLTMLRNLSTSSNKRREPILYENKIILFLKLSYIVMLYQGLY